MEKIIIVNTNIKAVFHAEILNKTPLTGLWTPRETTEVELTPLEQAIEHRLLTSLFSNFLEFMSLLQSIVVK